MPSVPFRTKHKASGHVAQMERMYFCYAPMPWQAIDTTENMQVLNDDFEDYNCFGGQYKVSV